MLPTQLLCSSWELPTSREIRKTGLLCTPPHRLPARRNSGWEPQGPLLAGAQPWPSLTAGAGLAVRSPCRKSCPRRKGQGPGPPETEINPVGKANSLSVRYHVRDISSGDILAGATDQVGLKERGSASTFRPHLTRFPTVIRLASEAGISKGLEFSYGGKTLCQFTASQSLMDTHRKISVDLLKPELEDTITLK